MCLIPRFPARQYSFGDINFRNFSYLRLENIYTEIDRTRLKLVFSDKLRYF